MELIYELKNKSYFKRHVAETWKRLNRNVTYDRKPFNR